MARVRSVVSDFATPWTGAHQVPLSMGFPRQEYWSGSPFPPPGELPNPGIKPGSLASPALAADSLHQVEPPVNCNFGTGVPKTALCGVGGPGPHTAESPMPPS